MGKMWAFLKGNRVLTSSQPFKAWITEMLEKVLYGSPSLRWCFISRNCTRSSVKWNKHALKLDACLLFVYLYLSITYMSVYLSICLYTYIPYLSIHLLYLLIHIYSIVKIRQITSDRVVSFLDSFAEKQVSGRESSESGRLHTLFGSRARPSAHCPFLNEKKWIWQESLEVEFERWSPNTRKKWHVTSVIFVVLWSAKLAHRPVPGPMDNATETEFGLEFMQLSFLLENQPGRLKRLRKKLFFRKWRIGSTLSVLTTAVVIALMYLCLVTYGHNVWRCGHCLLAGKPCATWSLRCYLKMQLNYVTLIRKPYLTFPE